MGLPNWLAHSTCEDRSHEAPPFPHPEARREMMTPGWLGNVIAMLPMVEPDWPGRLIFALPFFISLWFIEDA
jgi:hypothetical protein